MAKQFDVTLKALLEEAPEDWPALAGVTAAAVEVIDADIATLTGAADKVLLLPGPPAWIMHFDFQAGPDASLPRRLNVYNAALEARHDLPVASVLVLLRPQARLSNLTGRYEQYLPATTQPYRTFDYQVIQVWELSVAQLMQGGLGRLALAPIAAISEAELPGVVQELKRRADGMADRGQVGRWWTAVSILMGLRYEKTLIDQLLQGVLGMKESTTYQAILAEGRAEGRAEEARELLLRLGRKSLGEPDASVIAAVGAIHERQRLEQLLERVHDADSWQQLLEMP